MLIYMYVHVVYIYTYILHSIKELPHIYLCDLTSLVDLRCEGNLDLKCPPPEIATHGGVRVMQYMRDCRDIGRHVCLCVCVCIMCCVYVCSWRCARCAVYDGVSWY